MVNRSFSQNVDDNGFDETPLLEPASKRKTKSSGSYVMPIESSDSAQGSGKLADSVQKGYISNQIDDEDDDLVYEDNEMDYDIYE
jgi:hypothetical protein